MAFLSQLYGMALFSIAMGAIPKYEILDADGMNYYTTYFRIPQYKDKEILSEEKFSSIKLQAHQIPWDLDTCTIKAFHKVHHCLFQLNDTMESQFDRELSSIKNRIHGKRMIGVIVRGTDYTISSPKWHPVQPGTDEMIRIAANIIREDDFIYLASDEMKTVRAFEEKFGVNRIITSDSRYYDDIYKKKDIRIAYHEFERKNDRYLRGYEYYRRIYVLSKCDYVVSAMNGAMRMVTVMRNGKNQEIIDLGYYN